MGMPSVLPCYHVHLSLFVCGIQKQPSRSDQIHWQGVRGSTMHEGTSLEAVPCINNRIGPRSYVRIAAPTCESPLASLLDAVVSFAAAVFRYIASCGSGRPLLHISFVRPHITHSTLLSQRVGFNTRTSPFIHRIPPGQR